MGQALQEKVMLAVGGKSYDFSNISEFGGA